MGTFPGFVAANREKSHTPAVGCGRSRATSWGFFPSACMIHNACRFQNKIDFESGEYLGAYPASLMRRRLPPAAGVVQMEMAPPRAEANAMERPSEDQSAETSISSASVTRSELPLRRSIFQMSSLPARSVCVYTISKPLAENRGSRPRALNAGLSPVTPAVQTSDLFSSAIV